MSSNKHTTRRRTSSLDDESQAMLYDGLNLSQMTIAFGIDHRILVEKLHGVPATGSRNGTEIWTIATVAPYLVKPVGDIETYIKKMQPNDLPKALAKEFWSAIKTRQEVEKASGDLWPTERVVGVIGSLMKLLKMSVRLLTDSVDTQAELSEAQRRTVKQLGDSMLERLYAEVRDSFKPRKEGERELPVSPDATAMSERLVDLLHVKEKTFYAMLNLAQVKPKVLERAVQLAKEEDDEL